MKNIVVINIIVLLTILLFFSAYASAQEEAKIFYLKGVVKMQRSGEDFWILAKKGMVLKDNDRVKTLKSGDAEIALDSSLKNIVKLEGGTEVTIEDLKTKSLYMYRGKVLSVLESLPTGSSFEVRTPTAVAGVTGSGIFVETDGKKTGVRCHEDKAYVRGVNIDGVAIGEVLVIDEGYKRFVGHLQAPGELIILTGYEKGQWSNFRESLREHLDWLREKRAEGSREAALAMDRLGRAYGNPNDN
ncbi:FecR domain-containing protein [Candidatus Omnitrophota bacterium]